MGEQFESYVRGLIGDRTESDSSYIAHGDFEGRPEIAAVTGGRDHQIDVPAGYAAIVVNREGAFFQSRFLISNGRFAGGTVQARRAILLHEIAHGLEKIAADFNDPATVRANDRIIYEHCRKTIER